MYSNTTGADDGVKVDGPIVSLATMGEDIGDGDVGNVDVSDVVDAAVVVAVPSLLLLLFRKLKNVARKTDTATRKKVHETRMIVLIFLLRRGFVGGGSGRPLEP